MTTSQQPEDHKPTPANLPGATALPQPPAASSRPHASLEAHQAFGSVGQDGNVYVDYRGQRLLVGAYPEASPEEAVAYFARKFDELEAQVALLESRVERKAPAADSAQAAAHLQDQLEQRGVVGDIASLESRLAALQERIQQRTAEEKTENEQAKSRNLAERERIVAAAEDVAAQDPASTHWKNSSARLSELFDAWKKAQREMRLPKSQEDALWKRFRAARTTFDKHRRGYFSQLDQDNAKAKRVKEELIREAEALSSSTDWGETSQKFRQLMDRWKAAPRASRKEDDALWARFRKAQDVFFDARTAHDAEAEKEFEGNLAVKEELLARAQALLPVTDPEAAKTQLAPILDAWDEAGMVPRQDVRRVENELKKVQDAVSAAEQREWDRSNPETQARASSMITQLQEGIAQLEEELAQAESQGNAVAAEKAREALAARRQWLEMARATSD